MKTFEYRIHRDINIQKNYLRKNKWYSRMKKTFKRVPANIQ